MAIRLKWCYLVLIVLLWLVMAAGLLAAMCGLAEALTPVGPTGQDEAIQEIIYEDKNNLVIPDPELNHESQWPTRVTLIGATAFGFGFWGHYNLLKTTDMKETKIHIYVGLLVFLLVSIAILSGLISGGIMLNDWDFPDGFWVGSLITSTVLAPVVGVGYCGLVYYQRRHLRSERSEKIDMLNKLWKPFNDKALSLEVKRKLAKEWINYVAISANYDQEGKLEAAVQDALMEFKDTGKVKLKNKYLDQLFTDKRYMKFPESERLEKTRILQNHNSKLGGHCAHVGPDVGDTIMSFLRADSDPDSESWSESGRRRLHVLQDIMKCL